MKLEIYSKEKNDPVTLNLTPAANGDIILEAVDFKGQRCPEGHLLTIKRDGSFHLPGCVNPSLGFQLDGNGCIRVVR